MKTGILTQSYLMSDTYKDSAIDARQFALRRIEYGIGEQLLQCIMASTKPLVVQRSAIYEEHDSALQATRYTVECSVLYSDWLDCEVGEYALYRNQAVWKGVAELYQDGRLLMRFKTTAMHFNGDVVQILKREA